MKNVFETIKAILVLIISITLFAIKHTFGRHRANQKVITPADESKRATPLPEEKKDLIYLDHWNYNNLDEYLDLLEKLDWFKYLPPESREIIEAGLIDRQLEEFPMYSHTFHYDAECVYDEGCYTAIIKGISQISFGLFEPTKVSEEWFRENEEWKINLSLQLNTKEYTICLPYEGDYVVAEFYTFMDSAIRDYTKELCLKLLSGGQDGYFIICNNEAFKKAVLHKIIPWELRLDLLDQIC